MKVLLVVIDAATPRVVGPAIQTGRLPVLQRLAEAGTYSGTCTTIFPSITPAATTAIVTGEYPALNGILGASWYDGASNNVAYYGDDFWVVAREGFRAFLDDFLLRLNGDRLTSPTLFEIVERAGLRAASLNYLVYKGIHQHEAKVPATLRLLPSVRRTEPVLGPSTIAIGDFLRTRALRGTPHDDLGGALHRFGMDDATTGQLLFELMEDGTHQDLTVAYFADNDFRSHTVGPSGALPVIEHVDQMLGDAIDAAGGLDRVLQDTYVIVTSDHGHVEVRDEDDRSVIRLDETLQTFRQAPLGKPWGATDEILICPNMRAAQVYFREPRRHALRRAVDLLLAEPGIDHVISRPAETAERVRVESARGALEFWRGVGGAAHAEDEFGNVWSWDGELAILDARCGAGRLQWNNYPNAFERLAGAMEHPQSAQLWVTAKPGCEFQVPGGSAHAGGASHGGLHVLESHCPLLIAGPTRLELPAQIRTVDLAPLCLRLLGLPCARRVGEGRRPAA